MKMNIEKQNENKLSTTSSQLIPKKVLVRGDNGSYYAIRYVRSGEEEKENVNLRNIDIAKLLSLLDNNKLNQNQLHELIDHEIEFIRERIVKHINQIGLHKMINDESRVIREKVAERIDQVGLHKMMNDKSVQVRRDVAMRINQVDLHKLINDEDEVREIVVKRIDQSGLHEMMNDESIYIRGCITERINQVGLHEMMYDNNEFIRRIVTHRIDQIGLHEMMNDKSEEVRKSVTKRIDQIGLYKMINDKDYHVREGVTCKINQAGLHKMINDEKEYVRSGVVRRINQDGLHKMINDENENIRSAIVKRIDQVGLNEMKNDKSEQVRVEILSRVRDINNIKSTIDSYDDNKEVVLSNYMKDELKYVMEKDKSSTNMIKFTNEFYKNINNGKFDEFHVSSKDDWERSSSSDLALLLKDSIMRQFGGEIRHHDAVSDYDKKANELYDDNNKSNVDEYVKIQKNLTRKYLDQMFPDTDIVTLYRGTTENEIQTLGDDNKIIVKSNPLSSWTLKESVANDFSKQENKNGIVLTTKVHKDDIWSTFMSHAYEGNEREILLIGSKDREVDVI